MRLMASGNTKSYVNDTQRQGLVEMCVEKEYRRVCDENWNNKEASVVCGELGLSRYGRLELSVPEGSLVLGSILTVCGSVYFSLKIFFFRSDCFAWSWGQWRTACLEERVLYRH